jgi:hypothetical protein
VEDDIIASDQLHEDRVGENQRLFSNEEHMWYYIEGHRPDQLETLAMPCVQMDADRTCSRCIPRCVIQPQVPKPAKTELRGPLRRDLPSAHGRRMGVARHPIVDKGPGG